MKYRNGTPQPGFYCHRGHRYKQSAKTRLTNGFSLERRCDDCGKTQHAEVAPSFAEEFPSDTLIFADGLIWHDGTAPAAAASPWMGYYP